jgi:nodulation protein E
MTLRRVVVTGLGVISALGPDCEAFRSRLFAGESAIAPMPEEIAGPVAGRPGAMVGGYDPQSHFEKRDLEILDRFAQFAAIAAREAVARAGVHFRNGLGARSAVVTGSCVGGKSTEDDGFKRLYRDGKQRMHPLSVPRIMANGGASRIAFEFGLTGPALTISTACSSANHALGHAFWMVRSGLVDVALAGGSEAPLSPGHLLAWEALRLIDPETCRPFSKHRKGTVLGEGAAILLLETLERARERGAEPLAEIVGFGMTCDAYHLTQGSVEGPAAAMRAALADGGLTPESIDYVNAHGTGTPANDPTEVKAVREVFGEHADRLLISSTKSSHGHALGAAGAIEGAATALALAEGVVPPTANFTEPDPACDLDFVPNRARSAPLRAALSNSFAFGGLNAVIAMRRFTDSPAADAGAEPSAGA